MLLKEYVTDHLAGEQSNPKPKLCGKMTCGPCNLCGNNQQNRWAHKYTIKSASLLEVMSECCPNLQPNHCFCNSCKRQLEEKVKNPTRELSFLKEPQPKENCTDLCFLSTFGSCNDVARTHTCMYTSENMESTFNIKIEFDLPVPLPLCNTHHMKIYNRCMVLSCAACNVVLRSTEQKYTCASFVEDLRLCSTRLHAVNVDASLKDSDFLCLSCKMIATKVDSVQANLNQIQQDLSKPLSQPSAVQSALNFVMQKLCETCQSRNGVLLIDLYDMYIQKLQEFSRNQTDGNVDWEMYKYNSRWLWSNIYCIFGNIIEKYSSPNKRHSHMLFYRKSTTSNLQSALHAALAKIRTLEQQIKNSEVDEVRNNEDKEPNSNIMLQCTIPVLNQKLRTQAIRITDKYVQDPDKVISFNYNEMFKDIDPVIWNTIAVLTMTVNERKYFESKNVLWETEHLMFPSKGLYAQQRFHRRINACLVLQFAMNEDFNYPLHIIHANCIKHLSHSSKLLRLFNQAGLCVSENVLQAFLDRAKSSSKSKDLPLKPFTVVSVDNIDVLSPYAAVSTATDRSWHGTSVLAQQPLPGTELWNPIGEYLYDPIHKFKKVKVYGDGRCFYRSVASYLHLSLLNCERNIVGFPVNGGGVEICGSQVNLFEFEKILADAIQVKSCEILSEHVHFLDTLPSWVKESLLEEQSGNFFANFTDRIMKKKSPSAYAGRLEISATSFLLQREIRVYQCIGGKLELTIKFPPVAVDLKNHICLLYHADERNSPGHFDLLYCSSCRIPGENNLVKVSDTGSVLFLTAAASSISMTALFDPNMQQFSIDVDNSVRSSDVNSLSIQSTHSVSTNFSAPSTAKRPKKPSYCKSTKPDLPTLQKPAILGTPNSAFKTYVKDQVTLDRFEISVEEESVSKKFEAQLFLYVLERYTSVLNLTSVKIPGLKCKLALENPTHCEASNFKYMRILDEKADRPETIESVCADMYNKFKINDELNHLIIAGDAATYEIINRVKAANGGFYDWVIPYLGDWHIRYLKMYRKYL